MHTNQYGSFLDKLRTKNFINTIRPPNNQIMIQGPNSFVCVPQSNNNCSTNNDHNHHNNNCNYAPKLSVGDLNVNTINNVTFPIGIVAQTYIYNKQIVQHCNQSGDKDIANLISGDNSFCININNDGNCHQSHQEYRYIKINASIIIVDPTPNLCGHVFFTILDTQSQKKINVATEYCTSTSTNFTTTICFEHYMTVPANIIQQIQLFATSTSKTCYISKNIGMYDEDEFQVGPSYFTITDVGKGLKK